MMSDVDQATILIRGSRSQNDSTRVHARRGIMMPRPSVIALLGLVLLFIGWGAWGYFGPSTHIEDDDSIADLDGFEPPSPAQRGLSKSLSLSEGPDDVSPFSVSPVSIEPSLSLNAPLDSISANERADSGDVWLTGTIEEDEPMESMAAPQRISGVPIDGGLQR
jgi:hypothetical protein